MILNYIKTGFRHFKNKPIYAILNSVGLAVGLASFLLIIAIVKYEENFDKDVNTDQHLVHRVILKRYDPDTKEMSSAFARLALPFGKVIKEEIPNEVSLMTRCSYTEGIFDIDKEKTEEKELLFVDPSFLDIFRCIVLKGNSKNILTEPNSIVLSQTLAEKYFGNENPVGKTINYYTWQYKGPLKITGVIADFPLNSSFRPKALLSLNSIVGPHKYHKPDSWKETNSFMTFITFKNELDKEAAMLQMPHITKIAKPLVGDDNDWEFFFQPADQMRLQSDFREESKGLDNTQVLLSTVKIIGLLIIIISWVNFINITTASAITRAREVGSRKALGAQRKDVIIQFFVESILYNILALVLAALLLSIVVKPFLALIEAEYTYEIFFRVEFLLYMLGIVLIGIFCSGMYPALVLSSFSPRIVMNSKKSSSPTSERMRKCLVGLQFLISMLLLMGTGVLLHQTIHMKNIDKGIDFSNVMVLNAPSIHSKDKVIATYGNFINALKDLPMVKIASASTSVPAWWTGTTSVRRQSSEEMKGYIRSAIGIDENYFELYDIPFIAGENFNKENNKEYMILTDRARKSLSFDKLQDVFDDELNAYLYDYRFKIKGVVKDYKHNLLDTDIVNEGIIFMPMLGTNELPNVFSVKFKKNINIKEGIANVKEVYDKFFPEDLFKHSFVGDEYEAQLEDQKIIERMFVIFSSIALLLMLMGVIGLSSFIANMRLAEVAIRKILGAKTIDILKELSKEFFVIFIITSIIAILPTWYVMNQWLQDYNYRIDIGIQHFILPMLIVFFLTLVVVFYNTFRVLRIHPSKALNS